MWFENARVYSSFQMACIRKGFFPRFDLNHRRFAHRSYFYHPKTKSFTQNKKKQKTKHFNQNDSIVSFQGEMSLYVDLVVVFLFFFCLLFYRFPWTLNIGSVHVWKCDCDEYCAISALNWCNIVCFFLALYPSLFQEIVQNNKKSNKMGNNEINIYRNKQICFNFNMRKRPIRLTLEGIHLC